MTLSRREALNTVLKVIQNQVDDRATISTKTGKPVIHYAVLTGGLFASRSGRQIPEKVFKTMPAPEAQRICQDMGWECI
jgi:hypothetical protein